jgi:type VI secretion system protein ImpH
MTEYARERLRNAADPTLSRFLDIFHHRFLELFYRAWAQAQPHVNRDRPEADRFTAYVGAFTGMSPAGFRNRDAVPDVAKFFHVGALVRQVRNAEGLAAILEHFFRVPARIQQFVGHWMPLGPRERTYLGREGARLGSDAVLGRTVWDRQHKFRIRLGPLTLRQYESFLPVPPKSRSEGTPAEPAPRHVSDGKAPVGPARPANTRPLKKLVDWVRLYGCMELEWDVQLTLGQTGQLGWTTWLGTRPAVSDADDLCLAAETFVGPAGVGAA